MGHSTIQLYGSALVASISLSAILTALSIRLCKKYNILDVPDHRKIHQHPIPRMGGVAIFLGFVLPIVVLQQHSIPQKGVILGASAALIVGALDDLFQISAIVKLISLFILTLLLSQFGIVVNFPFPFLANVVITMVWITGITSAMNALDHMDGLAAGVSAIAASMYLLVSIQTNQFVWGLMSVCLIGSLGGYLIFNRYPAKTFMGDSGSFFLGFTLAIIGVMGGWSENPVKAAIVPVAILSLPIFDLTYVIIKRRLSGTTKTIAEAVTYCAKDHIGHRLIDLGFSIPKSVSFVYLISTSVALAAVVMRHASTLEAILIFIQIILIYIIIVIFMNKPGEHADSAKHDD